MSQISISRQPLRSAHSRSWSELRYFGRERWPRRAWWNIRQRAMPSTLPACYIILHLEPLDAWVVDETGWVKQGNHSVGVARQYCGAVGKQANCQESVEVVVSDGWVAAPVGGGLYLPESWASDRKRCRAAGIPGGVKFATQPESALEILRRARDGVPPAPLLADSVYGNNTHFRAAVGNELGMEFFLQVDGNARKGWDHEVATEVKRIRRHVRDGEPPAQTWAELTRAIPEPEWKNCSWVTARGQTRRTRLAWREVYLQSESR